jgi:hypothetical protein
MPYSGKAITQAQLAKLLKAYKVKPKLIRISERVGRGYEFAEFESAFRYIPVHADAPPETDRYSVTKAENGQSTCYKSGESVTPRMAENSQCNGVTPDLGGRAHAHDPDPFASLKDESLKLTTYPDLPEFLNRRVG